MILEVYSWHTSGLQVRKEAETMAISCPDSLISQPQHFQALCPAWAAASLPESHPILVEILETHSSSLPCAGCF